MSIPDSIQGIMETAPPNTDWGVALLDAHGQPVYEQAADKPFGAASLAKLGIAHVLTEQGGDLPFGFWERDLTVAAADKRPGGGLLQYFPDDYRISPEAAMGMMIRESDNTAARLLVQALGGAVAVNGRLAASSLELEVTRLEPVTEDTFTFGRTTAAEAARLMLELAGSQAADSLRETTMWYGLCRDIDRRAGRHMALFNRLVRFTQGGGPAWIYEAVLKRQYPRSQFPHKNGSLEDKRHDAAVINGYAIAALSAGYDSRLSHGRRHPAHAIHRQLGSAVAEI